jgi:nucleotide-binding universal stress UspA family protein
VTFVLGYDDSPGAVRALDVAVDLAGRYAEPLVLVYGVAPPGGVGEEFRAHQAAVEELGRQATEHALERALAAGVDTTVALVHDKPAPALVTVADSHDARMIIVGTAGESQLRGMLLGSTAYRLLNSTTRPVLVVPPG